MQAAVAPHDAVVAPFDSVYQVGELWATTAGQFPIGFSI